MDDGTTVGLIESCCNLSGILQGTREWQRAASEPLGQRLAFEQLHDQEVSPLVAADVVKRRDVRVIQPGDRLGFALKTGSSFRQVGKIIEQHLDGNGSLETRIARFIDLTHAAAADARKNLVVAQSRAGGQGQDGSGVLNRLGDGYDHTRRFDPRRPAGRLFPDGLTPKQSNLRDSEAVILDAR